MILLASLALAQLADRYVPGDEGILILLSGTVLSALICGFVFGALVGFVSVLGQNFLFLDPRGSFGLESFAQFLELAHFLLISLFLGWVGSLLRRSYALAEGAKKIALEESRAKEELLAIVSHDLKNPLNAIRLNTQLLSMSAGLRSNDPAMRSLVAIDRAVDRSVRLIHDLLDFERIRVGTLRVEAKPEAADVLLEEVRELMGPIAAQKAQRLTVKPGRKNLGVLCDRERLLQVFSNLVGNAVKFTAKDGTIELGISEEAEFVVFRVTDSGVGIPPTQLPHVFDRYWQAPNTARQGTGLGLSIAKGIIEAHGGSIWVESEPGRGSTFSFRLPKTATAGAGVRDSVRKRAR